MNEEQSSRRWHILVVDDSPGDVRLMREALQEDRICTQLSEVRDGVEALAFLRQKGTYVTAPRPDLILLDLNLPRMDGCELLQEIKSDVHLRRIPVVVLTISQSPEDVRRVYDLHANCYIAKPLDLDHFAQVVQSVESFWFSTATLPPEGCT